MMTATIAGVKVKKRYGQTFVAPRADPGGRTRRECWGATTVDGDWDFRRIDDRGTPWVAVYVPLDLDVGHFGSLRRAVMSVADPAQAERAIKLATQYEAEFLANRIRYRRLKGQPDFTAVDDAPPPVPQWLRDAALAIVDAESSGGGRDDPTPAPRSLPSPDC